MTNKQKLLFWLVVGLQLLFLTGVIAKKQHLLATGKKVLLECAPIDPRSLFSGDYVILRYKIKELERWFSLKNLNPDNESFAVHQTIYVALKEQDNGFWEPVEISSEMADLQQYPIAIRGVVESASRLQVRYGVEQYFVPQNEGLAIERSSEKLTVEVVVDQETGESAVNKIFLGGREVKFK